MPLECSDANKLPSMKSEMTQDFTRHIYNKLPLCAAITVQACIQKNKLESVTEPFRFGCVAGGSAVKTYVLDKTPGLWKQDNPETLQRFQDSFSGGDIDIFILCNRSSISENPEIYRDKCEKLNREITKQITKAIKKEHASMCGDMQTCSISYDSNIAVTSSYGSMTMNQSTYADTSPHNGENNTEHSKIYLQFPEGLQELKNSALSSCDTTIESCSEIYLNRIAYQTISFGSREIKLNYVHFHLSSIEDEVVNGTHERYVILRLLNTFDLTVCQCAIQYEDFSTDFKNGNFKYVYTNECKRDVATKSITFSATAFSQSENKIRHYPMIENTITSRLLELLFYVIPTPNLKVPMSEVMIQLENSYNGYNIRSKLKKMRGITTCILDENAENFIYAYLSIAPPKTSSQIEENDARIQTVKSIARNINRHLKRAEKYHERGFSVKTRAEKNWIIFSLLAQKWVKRKQIAEALYHPSVLKRKGFFDCENCVKHMTKK